MHVSLAENVRDQIRGIVGESGEKQREIKIGLDVRFLFA